MNLKQINNQLGLSIIEVLIGAVVFMIGFSFLIIMLQNIYSKFSVNDLLQAQNIAQQEMDNIVWTEDFRSYDTNITVNNISYTINRDIEIIDSIAKIDITVTRTKTDKELMRLYNEVYIAK